MERILGLNEQEAGYVGACLNKIKEKQGINLTRSAYYNAKGYAKDLGIKIPMEWAQYVTVLGWAGKSVDALANRCSLQGFVVPGYSMDDLGVSDVWLDNNMQVEAKNAQTSSLIHGVSYVTTTLGDTQAGEPKVLVLSRDALSGAGIWNARKRGLDAFLSVIDRDKDGNETNMVLYLPDIYVTMTKAGKSWRVERRKHGLNRVPVEPLVYKQNVGRPFGNSRISHPVMSLTDAAIRTMYRAEVGAEFYSTPQRYILGADESAFVDDDGNPVDAWQYVVSRIVALGVNESTDSDQPIMPQVGQFPQMSQQPHLDQMRSIATLFSAETDLPVSSLGIIHDNPSSAEAIEAAERGLIIEAEATNLGYSAPWRNVGRNVYLLANEADVVPDEFANIKPKFANPAYPSMAAQAQSVMTLVQTGVLPADSDVTLERLGFDQTDIERIQADRRRTAGRSAMAQIAEAVNRGNAS